MCRSTLLMAHVSGKHARRRYDGCLALRSRAFLLKELLVIMAIVFARRNHPPSTALAQDVLCLREAQRVLQEIA